MSCRRGNMFKTIAHQCDLKELTHAIVKTGLKEAVSTSDPITVFGPTDEAFRKYKYGGKCDQVSDLKELLLYHVVPKYLKSCSLPTDKKYDTLLVQNENVRQLRINSYSSPTFNDVITVNGVPVVDADIKASNGILHKIQKVLCPPAGTIAQIAAGNPDFSILVAALQKAGLLNPGSPLLDPNANLTVFAPTNKAFEKLLVELNVTLDQLLNNPNLANILLYHVLGLTVFSPAIKEGKTKDIETLYTEHTLDLRRKCKKIKVRDENKRDARVILPDVLAENGVIHVIDKVLLPK